MDFKKVLTFFFIFFPLTLFAQGINKVNLALSTGVNIPIAGTNTFNGQSFNKKYKTSYNLGFQLDYTLGKSIALGMDVNHGKFPGTGAYPLPYFEKDKPLGLNYTSIMPYIKVQDNRAREDDIQIFVKAAGGVFYAQEDGAQFGIAHSNGFIAMGFCYMGGAGVNFMLDKGNKIFLESDYKFSPAGHNNFNALYLNAGFSFCLNP